MSIQYKYIIPIIYIIQLTIKIQVLTTEKQNNKLI